LRGSSLETIWVSQERDVEDVSALLEESVYAAVMHALWGHKADARVAADGVVPLEEALAVGADVFDAAETLREVGMIFERFELCLGVRIVIGDVGPAVVRAGALILRDTKEWEVYKATPTEPAAIRSDQLRSISHKSKG
jgi:hypothetical protein